MRSNQVRRATLIALLFTANLTFFPATVRAESLEGGVWVCSDDFDKSLMGGLHMRVVLQIHANRIRSVSQTWYASQPDPGLQTFSAGETSGVITGRKATWKSSSLDGNCGPITAIINEDGSTIVENYTCYGRTKTFTCDRR
jgi:hypothetical protein